MDVRTVEVVLGGTGEPPLGGSMNQERAEVNREAEEGELYTLTEEHPFPPTRYDRS